MQREKHIPNDEAIFPKDPGPKLKTNSKSLDKFYR
jgi:hypothetical protein